MGQISWLDCKTGKQIVNNRFRDVFVLVPKEYGGKSIREDCYDGYGNFRGKDIYCLIADWNKAMIPEIMKKIEEGVWECDVRDGEKQMLMNFYNDRPLNEGINGKQRFMMVEKRTVGIIMACYDKDNARLDYPIKITYNPRAVYEDCKPSLRDPDQGIPG